MTPRPDSPQPDPLIADVQRWLDRRGHSRDLLTALAGDVSPRRYLRLETADGASRIVAFYPASMRDTGALFRKTTELLTASGIPVPAILDWDPDAGIMLLSDAGRRSVHQAVADGGNATTYRRQAMPLLEGLGRLDRAAVAALNRPLNGTILRRELLQSWDLVLEPKGLVGERSLSEDFRLALFTLCDRLAQPDPRPCHRDFMARNLLLDREDRMVVIDHQDLRLGPPWYDLASLLNDSLYADPAEEADLLDRARVPRSEREMYHRAAAQRALKIVGTFTAFASRGADRHLALVPPSLTAARRHLDRLPETAPVMRDLGAAWELAGEAAAPSSGSRSLLD